MEMHHDHETMMMMMAANNDDDAAASSLGAHQHQHDLGGMMKMYFHFGLGDLFLFNGFVVDSSLKLCLVCLVAFMGAVLLEAIDYTRNYFGCHCAPIDDDDDDGLSCRARRTQSNTNSTTDLLQHINISNNNHYQQQQQHHGPVDSGAGAVGGPAGNWSSCCVARSVGCGSAYADAAVGDKLKRSRPPAGRLHKSRKGCQLTRLIQASLQFIRTGLSFGLMLAAMTYNVCIVFAILLGAGVGFYIFYRPALEIKSACH